MSIQETKSTTLSEMRKVALPTKVEDLPEVTVGFTTLQGFNLVQRAGGLLAASSIVPKHYQGNVPNCVVALNMAYRIGADVLMVMQNLYIVHGNPSWSSQFLIATFNTCGRFSALRYEFFGEKGNDDWGCRAYAIEKSTGEKLVGSDVTIGLAKKEGWYSKNGSKWMTMPQQMLMYRSAAWFVRAYAPELAMGLHTTEEHQDTVIDIQPANLTTIAELREQNTVEAEEETPAPKADPDTGEITQADMDEAMAFAAQERGAV